MHLREQAKDPSRHPIRASTRKLHCPSVAAKDTRSPPNGASIQDSGRKPTDHRAYHALYQTGPLHHRCNPPVHGALISVNPPTWSRRQAAVLPGQNCSRSTIAGIGNTSLSNNPLGRACNLRRSTVPSAPLSTSTQVSPPWIYVRLSPLVGVPRFYRPCSAVVIPAYVATRAEHARPPSTLPRSASRARTPLLRGGIVVAFSCDFTLLKSAPTLFAFTGSTPQRAPRRGLRCQSASDCFRIWSGNCDWALSDLTRQLYSST